MSKPNTRKPPAFQLYAQDFLMGTLIMTAAQVGGYIRLLCHQWVNGGLPDDDGQLALLSGISGIDLAQVRQKLASCSDGKLRNARLEEVRQASERFREKQSENAKKGWKGGKKRTRANAKPDAKPDATADAKPEPDVCSSSSSSKPPISPKGDAGEDPEIAEAIWTGHPQQGRTRSSRTKVAKAWKAVPRDDRPTLATINISLARWRASKDWTKEGGQYVPGAHRWVVDKKWEEDPLPARAGAPRSEQGGPLQPGDEGFVSCHDIGKI